MTRFNLLENAGYDIADLHEHWAEEERAMTMTPDKLREWAAELEAKSGAGCGMGVPSDWRHAQVYRAHAAALEEVERLKGLLAAAAKELPHCSGPVHERIAVYRREHAKQIEQAERRAERLKFHAEAMAHYTDCYKDKWPDSGARQTLDEYRAEFKGE